MAIALGLTSTSRQPFAGIQPLFGRSHHRRFRRHINAISPLQSVGNHRTAHGGHVLEAGTANELEPAPLNQGLKREVMAIHSPMLKATIAEPHLPVTDAHL